jgi:hypothetical protein
MAGFASDLNETAPGAEFRRVVAGFVFAVFFYLVLFPTHNAPHRPLMTLCADSTPFRSSPIKVSRDRIFPIPPVRFADSRLKGPQPLFTKSQRSEEEEGDLRALSPLKRQLVELAEASLEHSESDSVPPEIARTIMRQPAEKQASLRDFADSVSVMWQFVLQHRDGKLIGLRPTIQVRKAQCLLVSDYGITDVSFFDTVETSLSLNMVWDTAERTRSDL